MIAIAICTAISVVLAKVWVHFLDKCKDDPEYQKHKDDPDYWDWP